jgi:hypothetical protein
MSFSDPLSLTISGTTSSLPRINSGDPNSSEYQSGDGLLKVIASHQYKKERNRRMVRVDSNKITADPFRPSENREVSLSWYVVCDEPDVGYTAAEKLAVFVGFNTMLTASTNAMVSKLLGGES